MKKKLIIKWFRRDLRLNDNPSLAAASKKSNQVQNCDILPIYIFHEAIGSASKWWLHYSLKSLKNSLNGKLKLFVGDPIKVLSKIINEHDIIAIYYDRMYDKDSITRDKSIVKLLTQQDIEAHGFCCSLLFDPWEIINKSGSNYKVFTPFWKYIRDKLEIRKAISNPYQLKLAGKRLENELDLEDLRLLPSSPDWTAKMCSYWEIGEKAAENKLYEFIDKKVTTYKQTRNYPAVDSTSHLSPHLHFGEISPVQIWHAMQGAILATNSSDEKQSIEVFLLEIAWREFSYNLLYYFPELDKKHMRPEFDNFQWEHENKVLRAWQKGMTGVPIVDAAMRQLWQVGWMHNRLRMIVGSFLTKDLLIHWRHGAEWFCDCLVDADIANNSASWQWVAGSGIDAAPYYRIFNPYLQSKRFDEEGAFIRKYVPEISQLSNIEIHEPHLSGKHLDYPPPIVDHNTRRAEAMARYRRISKPH